MLKMRRPTIDIIFISRDEALLSYLPIWWAYTASLRLRENYRSIL